MTPTEGSDRTKHTWPEFLARAATLATPGEEPLVVTNSDLICWWAEQAGGAHEDWEFKQSFVELAFFPARVGGSGLPLGHHNLLTIAKNASKSAHRLLSDLDSLRRIKALTEEARAGRAARRRSPAGR